MNSGGKAPRLEWKSRSLLAMKKTLEHGHSLSGIAGGVLPLRNLEKTRQTLAIYTYQKAENLGKTANQAYPVQWVELKVGSWTSHWQCITTKAIHGSRHYSLRACPLFSQQTTYFSSGDA